MTEAAESVLGGTFGDFELLIIDDGSTDQTAAIASDLAKRDARVTIITLRHGGIAAALNAGIERARGRYIGRMDADDVSLPRRLEKQFTYLESHPECVAVGCAIDLIDETGQSLGQRAFSATHSSIVDDFLHGTAPLAHPGVLVRHETLARVGGYRAEKLPSEDYDLWMRLSEHGTLANLEEPLLRYRRHRATIGVRERKGQLAMRTLLVNEARQRRGLGPIRIRTGGYGKSEAANYHFECARIALRFGPRRIAMRHAGATIASDPLWPEAYALLAACLLPKWTIGLMHQVLTRTR